MINDAACNCGSNKYTITMGEKTGDDGVTRLLCVCSFCRKTELWVPRNLITEKYGFSYTGKHIRFIPKEYKEGD